MSEQRIRIGLIHALQASIAPIETAFSRFWPEAEAVNLLDGSLYLDYDAAGEVTPEITRRIRALIDHAAGFGARGLLLTGSLFSQPVQDARKELSIPALAAYEAMIEEAFASGSRFGLIATYADTITMMEADIECYARAKGFACTVETKMVEGALDAVQSGDRERHDWLVAAAAEGLAECDVLLLAQHSMSPVKERIPERAGRRVLTSSETAVRKLRELVEARES
jgi:Asp/Glu/hydantoin racemase